MRLTLFILFLSVIFPSLSFSQQLNKDSIRVFCLAGQSNMEGYGYNSELPQELSAEFENVYIYQGNSVADEKLQGGLGVWKTLKPGHGVGFSADRISNKLSDRFGIELSFAKKLQELYPNEKIALIKYVKGGSAIDSLAGVEYGSWEADYIGENGINQYDNFLTTIKGAFENNDIDGDGKEDHLIPSGIIWMQGESDAAHTEETAKRYYANLKRLTDMMRASLHSDDLPIVIGKISDSKDDEDGKVWDYAELVQKAQEQYAERDKNATIVRSTENYNYSDTWHYDSDGYIDLGQKFADALYQLRNKK